MNGQTEEKTAEETKEKTEKPKKERQWLWRMNGGYKGDSKRPAYVLTPKSLLKVVEEFKGKGQIFRDGKWENLKIIELRRLVKEQEDVQKAAKSEKSEQKEGEK